MSTPWTKSNWRVRAENEPKPKPQRCPCLRKWGKRARSHCSSQRQILKQLERLKLKEMKTPNAGEDTKQPELSPVASGSVQLYDNFGNGSFLHIWICIYPMTQCSCPREMRMYSHKKTCTGTLIAALFIIVKHWKWLKYGEMNKQTVVHLHME